MIKKILTVFTFFNLLLVIIAFQAFMFGCSSAIWQGTSSCDFIKSLLIADFYIMIYDNTFIYPSMLLFMSGFGFLIILHLAVFIYGLFTTKIIWGNKRLKLLLFTLLVLIPSYSLITRLYETSQHIYYWDVINKGKNIPFIQHSLETFIGGGLLILTYSFVVFLLLFVFIRNEIKSTKLISS